MVHIHHSPHGRRDGQQDAIVKVSAAAAGRSATVQHSFDRHGDLVDVQALADRIRVAEQVAFHRAADHTDPGHGGDVFVGDSISLGRVPVPGVVPLRLDTPHRRLNLVGAVPQAGTRLPRLRSDDIQIGDLLADRADIGQGERRDVQIGRSDRPSAAGDQHHRSRAEVLDPLHHLRFGAFADGHDHGQCGDADDGARHHEKRSQRIGCQRVETFSSRTQNPHAPFSSAGISAASSASASRG